MVEGKRKAQKVQGEAEQFTHVGYSRGYYNTGYVMPEWITSMEPESDLSLVTMIGPRGHGKSLILNALAMRSSDPLFGKEEKDEKQAIRDCGISFISQPHKLDDFVGHSENHKHGKEKYVTLVETAGTRPAEMNFGKTAAQVIPVMRVSKVICYVIEDRNSQYVLQELASYCMMSRTCNHGNQQLRTDLLTNEQKIFGHLIVIFNQVKPEDLREWASIFEDEPLPAGYSAGGSGFTNRSNNPFTRNEMRNVIRATFDNIYYHAVPLKPIKWFEGFEWFFGKRIVRSWKFTAEINELRRKIASLCLGNKVYNGRVVNGARIPAIFEDYNQIFEQAEFPNNAYNVIFTRDESASVDKVLEAGRAAIANLGDVVEGVDLSALIHNMQDEGMKIIDRYIREVESNAKEMATPNNMIYAFKKKVRDELKKDLELKLKELILMSVGEFIHVTASTFATHVVDLCNVTITDEEFFDVDEISKMIDDFIQERVCDEYESRFGELINEKPKEEAEVDEDGFVYDEAFIVGEERVPLVPFEFDNNSFDFVKGTRDITTNILRHFKHIIIDFAKEANTNMIYSRKNEIFVDFLLAILEVASDPDLGEKPTKYKEAKTHFTRKLRRSTEVNGPGMVPCFDGESILRKFETDTNMVVYQMVTMQVTDLYQKVSRFRTSDRLTERRGSVPVLTPITSMKSGNASVIGAMNSVSSFSGAARPPPPLPPSQQ